MAPKRAPQETVMGFDGQTKGGVRNGLWGVLAVFVVLAALFTVLMRTATFIELAVWFQTDRSERVVNSVLVNPNQWLNPTLLVVTEGKSPKNRKTQAYTLSWGSLHRIGEIKAPSLSLIYSDPIQDRLDVLILRTRCGEPQCAEDVALLTTDWTRFRVGHRWSVPSQFMGCNKPTLPEVRYYSQINKGAPGQLLRMQNTMTMAANGDCESHIRVASYVVENGRLIPEQGLRVIE
jgi:hypothetical protein